jgi:hypothetical protein
VRGVCGKGGENRFHAVHEVPGEEVPLGQVEIPDIRGLRLTHDAHTFVLGIPAVFGEYFDERPAFGT